MTIFVDGYNLIFAASRVMGKKFDIQDTEAARENLIELLARFRALTQDRIVVFFDGGPEAAHLPRRQFVRGMEVVFSQVRGEADADIKNAVCQHAEPGNLRVVTSDTGIARFVTRYGSRVTDSVEFLHEVQKALHENALPQDEPMEKYGEISPEEADYWRQVFEPFRDADGD